MKEFKLTLGSLGWLITELTKLLQSTNKTYRVTIKEWREKRSLSQNGLQHVIYETVSKYLISKGRTEWTKEKVKESLKSKFLGWEQREIVDVVTGEVIVKELLIETSKLDVGDAYHYTTKIIDWAESIGCQIKIPSKCEYRDLMDIQND